MLVEKVLYCAQVKATAGREIRAVSSDGILDLKVTRPRELGGTNGWGTTPEQLFAASYAASFLGIMRIVAGREDIELPADTEVEASVGVGPAAHGFGIEVELRIYLQAFRGPRLICSSASHTCCVRTPTPCAETWLCGWCLPKWIMLRFPARVTWRWQAESGRHRRIVALHGNTRCVRSRRSGSQAVF